MACGCPAPASAALASLRADMTRVIVILAALTAGGCGWLGRSARIDSGTCRGCNVLLITIDTLRTDRVGAFGSQLGLTPNLDRLAAGGFRFTRTYTSAPLTLPAHASILTATQPPVHGLRANGLFRLGPNPPTLATTLKSAGYRTGAFVGSFVLDARFGLNRGFDVYDDRYGERHADDGTEGAERRAEDVIKPALDWILGNQPSALSPQPSVNPSALSPQPFFAWVHFYDPHEPYRAPEPYASRFAPYDAEVAYTDATLGRLDRHPAGVGATRTDPGRDRRGPRREPWRAWRTNARRLRLRRDDQGAVAAVGRRPPARHVRRARPPGRSRTDRPRSRRRVAAARIRWCVGHSARTRRRDSAARVFRSDGRQPHAQLGAARRPRQRDAQADRSSNAGAVRSPERSGRIEESLHGRRRARADAWRHAAHDRPGVCVRISCREDDAVGGGASAAAGARIRRCERGAREARRTRTRTIPSASSGPPTS